MQPTLEFLHKKIPGVPELAVILGSGAKMLEDLQCSISFSYQEVFGISPSVTGHSGILYVGYLHEKLIAVLKGRFHFYEGYSWEQVTLPVRALAAWGVRNIFLTNAAGGLNPSFKVGDLMLISGYLDLLNPKWKETGLLPALKQPPVNCHNQLTQFVWDAAQQVTDLSVALKKGTYAGLLGPNYETFAEIEMLRKLKCDAVGMSTVPELIALAKTNCQAAAISIITNVWSHDQPIHGHEEVLQAAKRASLNLGCLLQGVIRGLE